MHMEWDNLGVYSKSEHETLVWQYVSWLVISLPLSPYVFTVVRYPYCYHWRLLGFLDYNVEYSETSLKILEFGKLFFRYLQNYQSVGLFCFMFFHISLKNSATSITLPWWSEMQFPLFALKCSCTSTKQNSSKSYVAPLLFSLRQRC